MIYSMTAFARLEAPFAWGSVICEIRSVNHRYLEPSFKLPDSLRAVEYPLRESLRKQLGRGKVETHIRLQCQEQDDQALHLNNELAQQLINAAESLANTIKRPANISPLELLRWPGVLAEAKQDQNEIHSTVISVFNQAVADLLQARVREGTELKVMVEQRLDAIDKICIDIEAALPNILKQQRQRLIDRVAELQVQLDPERLEQEMVLIAQKADVDEELDRLKTHVNEVRRVLKKGGHCGRRLDFLMQELNREANTLSSKSHASLTTQAAVELKVLIEQMREQIQNIE